MSPVDDSAGLFCDRGTRKHKNVNANLINPTIIQIESECFDAWPNFSHRGVKRLRGLWNPQHLRGLLYDEDLFCHTWRSSIPQDVLYELKRYPDHHSELIELAQLDPARFIHMSRYNPSLTVAVATFWAFKPPWRMPARLKRDARRFELLQMKLRSVLSALGLRGRKEWLRILAKIPASHCGIFHIKSTLQLCEDNRQRRHLRHLSNITPEVRWLMEHPSLPLDMPLLELAAKEPEREGFRLTDLVSSIITSRGISGMELAWPYMGAIRNWESLLRAEWRNAIHCSEPSLQFPPAPVAVESLPGGLEIHPLTSPKMVKEEADQMQNCSEQFLEAIQRGESYLYRVIRPERATLQLHCESSGWEIVEIGLHGNVGKASYRTECLLYQWLRQNKKTAKRH